MIAGVDEAGRGSWAGPVVAAAVILPRSLPNVRLDDSKRLSPAQRERACAVLRERASIGVGIVSAGAIDRTDILRATLAAMQQAVEQLRPAPGLVLIDGISAPALAIPCRTIIDGDQLHPAISAASIVAKVTRDALMRFYHRLLPDYAFDQHKGYGTALHQARLAACGPSLLHRLSFRPVTPTDPSAPASGQLELSLAGDA